MCFTLKTPRPARGWWRRPPPRLSHVSSSVLRKSRGHMCICPGGGGWGWIQQVVFGWKFSLYKGTAARSSRPACTVRAPARRRCCWSRGCSACCRCCGLRCCSPRPAGRWGLAAFLRSLLRWRKQRDKGQSHWLVHFPVCQHGQKQTEQALHRKLLGALVFACCSSSLWRGQERRVFQGDWQAVLVTQTLTEDTESSGFQCFGPLKKVPPCAPTAQPLYSGTSPSLLTEKFAGWDLYTVARKTCRFGGLFLNLLVQTSGGEAWFCRSCSRESCVSQAHSPPKKWRLGQTAPRKTFWGRRWAHGECGCQGTKGTTSSVLQFTGGCSENIF